MVRNQISQDKQKSIARYQMHFSIWLFLDNRGPYHLYLDFLKCQKWFFQRKSEMQGCRFCRLSLIWIVTITFWDSSNFHSKWCYCVLQWRLWRLKWGALFSRGQLASIICTGSRWGVMLKFTWKKLRTWAGMGSILSDSMEILWIITDLESNSSLRPTKFYSSSLLE